MFLIKKNVYPYAYIIHNQPFAEPALCFCIVFMHFGSPTKQGTYFCPPAVDKGLEKVNTHILRKKRSVARWQIASSNPQSTLLYVQVVQDPKNIGVGVVGVDFLFVDRVIRHFSS